YIVGSFQQSLLDLKQNIERLRLNEEALNTASRIEMARWLRSLDGDGPEQVKNLELILILAIHDRQANVVRLNRAIHRAASGDSASFHGVESYGNSPFDEQTAQMQR